MEPLPERLVARLDVAGAIERELATRHSLLPPLHGLDVIAQHGPAFSRHLRAQLRDGLAATPADVVDARKQRHGIRPLSVMTVEEQVLYRCLTEIVLEGVQPPDRSPGAYVDFIQAPIYYASSRTGSRSPFRMIFGSDITHVLKSDITAFYQYVDHAVLRNELLTISPDFDAVDALMMLLREVQGRDFGLPQLYYASDWLSEIYIDVLEVVPGLVEVRWRSPA